MATQRATLNAAKAAAAGTAGQDADTWALFDAATGGNELWRASLANNPPALTAGQNYRIRANQFSIDQPHATQESEESVRRKLRGMLGPTTWVQLFDGSTAVTARIAIPLSEWTIATAPSQ